MDEDVKKKAGQQLRRFRKRRRLSQQEVANALDITVSTVSRIERGVVGLTLKNIYTLCEAFNVDIKEFFEESDEEVTPDKTLFRGTDSQKGEMQKEIETFVNYLLHRYKE